MAKFLFNPLKKIFAQSGNRAIQNAVFGDGLSAQRIARSLGGAMERMAALFTDSYHFSFANLVPNGSFEVQTDENTPPDGWSVTEGDWGVGMDLVPSELSGSNSLKFEPVDGAATTHELTSDRVVIEGGKRHRASMSVNINGALGMGDGVFLGVNYYDRDGEPAGSDNVATINIGFTFNNDLTNTFLPPSNARFIEFVITTVVGGVGHSNLSIEVDHVSVPNRIVSGLNDFRHTMFTAYLANNMPNQNGTVRIEYDSESSDYGNNFNSTTTWEYTVPEDGIYEFFAQVLVDNLKKGTETELSIETDSALINTFLGRFQFFIPPSGANTNHFLQVIAPARALEEGDTVYVRVQGDGDFLVEGNNDGTHTWFSGKKLADTPA